jgi:hydrogenase maturation protease
VSIVVIGIGNTLRGDDGAGLAVAELVRARAPRSVDVRVCEQEPSRLVDALADADVALVVDAVSTGAPAGTVHRFDVDESPVPSRGLRSSTHAFGIGESLELARVLVRLPRHTVVFGVEGSEFGAGASMTRAVEEGVALAAAAVLEEVGQCTSEP